MGWCYDADRWEADVRMAAGRFEEFLRENCPEIKLSLAGNPLKIHLAVPYDGIVEGESPESERVVRKRLERVNQISKRLRGEAHRLGLAERAVAEGMEGEGRVVYAFSPGIRNYTQTR